MKISRFEINNISFHQDDEITFFVGEVVISVDRDDGLTSNNINLRVRINQETRDLSFVEVERLLFDEAKRQIDQVARAITDGSVESVRQAVAEHRALREAQDADALQAEIGGGSAK